MEISEIKEQLTMSNVLHYYGLKTDKQSRINCPFHEDKTPSMQVYYKTQMAYYFSSNCKTHGKAMDVIDFILHKENSIKGEAIRKAKEILGYQKPDSKGRYQPELSREQFLSNMYQYFKNSVSNSKPAKDYLHQRSLDFKRIEIGYNAGKFHHGSRKEENLIALCLQYGLLIDKGLVSRTGEKAYGVFGKWSICFALKNKAQEIAGLYFRSTLNDKESKHFYLKNRKGLYPNYPAPNTKKLILTESIIDCASLLQNETITKEYAVLACYGTNGLTEEHQQAIQELPQLDEIIFFFDNDRQERLLSHTHQLNGGEVENLARNTYDELGQLTAKKVGGQSLAGLQQVDYLYNIRGWLTHINQPYNLNPAQQPRDLFALQLSYDQPLYKGAQALYNGNISETIWKSTSDNQKRQYVYQYDPLNRLTQAIYLKNHNPATGSFSVANAYNEKISYDKNGNILSLDRNGAQDISNNVTTIDLLSYTYLPGSNHLSTVRDRSNHPDGFTQKNTSGKDFEYDTNGNLILDAHKGISSISYNYLNIPSEIFFTSGNKISYLYDASGTKMQKSVTQNGKVTPTLYLGGFQYENNLLQFFPHSEGYYEYLKKQYVYNYTDHLGNLRLSYAQENEILKTKEENHYYPFGLKHSGYNSLNEQPSYAYKYNGKELQKELGLNVYDYGARNYDPALGRWFNLDPLAEVMPSWSPYNYTLNNPVKYIDPDGMAPTDIYKMNTNGSLEWVSESEKDVVYKANDFNSDNTVKEGATGFEVGDKGFIAKNTKTENGNAYINFGTDQQKGMDYFNQVADWTASGDVNVEFNIQTAKMFKMNAFGAPVENGESTIVGTNNLPTKVYGVYSGDHVSLNGHTHPGKMPNTEGLVASVLNPSGLMMHKFPTKENGYTFKVAGSSETNDIGAAKNVPNAINFIYVPSYNTTLIYNGKTMTNAYEGKFKK